MKIADIESIKKILEDYGLELDSESIDQLATMRLFESSIKAMCREQQRVMIRSRSNYSNGRCSSGG